MSFEQLLKVLADGKFHSGTELGDRLGISRAAVWKQLKKAELSGLPLTSIKSKGYRVEGGLDLLSHEAIVSGLDDRARALVTAVDVKGVVASTNDIAMAQAIAGTSGYVVTAEQQTAGRGRRGRSWVSPYGSNIYLSLVWRFDTGVGSLEGLSLATGVNIVATLERMGVNGLRLKWPNDVLHSGRKLAGVLIEITGDVAGPCQVALGIGLNVRMPHNASALIEQPWIDLTTIGAAPPRNQIVAALINQLLPMLHTFPTQGFRAYRKRWESLDAYAQKAVKLDVGEEVVEGTAIGVDPSGAIRIRTGEGVRVCNGGELRLLPDGLPH